MAVLALASAARHPAILASLVFIVLVLVVGNLAPPPSDWLRDEGERHVDVHVSVPLEWHPLLGRWTVGNVVLELSPSTWLNTGAWFTNLLSFGFTTSSPIVFTLEDPSTGQVLQERVGSTGSATPLTGTTVETIVFRTVELGDYQLRIKVQDEAGNTLTEAVRPLQIVRGQVIPQ